MPMTLLMRKKLLVAIAFALCIWAYLLLLVASPRGWSASASPPRSTTPAVAIASPPPVAPVDLDEGISALFSPGGGCTDAVVAEIGKATQSLDIQAYTFTSAAIAQAVVDAANRKVRVRIVLDKSEKTDRYSSATFFKHHEMAVYIDEQHAIAHNKVILIDGKTVITGSFNFTKAAEDHNAENLLIVHNRPRLISAYQANFEQHLGHSTLMR